MALRRINGMRPSRGFTVLELLLVLAVISTLVGLVIPSFYGSFRAEALPTSARDLRALVYQIRAQAMMEGMRFRVRFPREDELVDQPQRLGQPLVERESKPIEAPGVYEPVRAFWARDPVLRESIQCIGLELGMPRVSEELDELEEAPEFGEEGEELEIEDVRLIFEPDGSSEWATFRLAWLRTPDEKEDPETAPQLNVMIDGRTGQVWIQQPLEDEEVELLMREQGSHILHMDRIDAPKISEENILRLRDLL